MTYPQNKNEKSLFRIIVKFLFLTIYFLIAFSLLLALLAKIISPKTFYIPSLFALFFPVLFILFLFLTFIVLLRKYYITLFIVLPLLLWSFIVFNRYISVFHLFVSDDCPDNKTCKVMSFNARLFDVYNWKKGHTNYQQILDFIIQQQPDIACFQEYYYQSDGKYPTTEPLLKGLQTSYIHEYYTVINHNKYFFGIATISKYPIIKRGVIPFKGTSNMCIFSDIVVHGDTIRVFNMHLESVRLGIEDYAFISSVEHKPDSIEYNKTIAIYKRLKKSAIKRNIQADVIADSIKQSPYPVIVCGDFNDVPASYTYSKISKGLIDPFSKYDLSMGSTYNGDIPFIRIDYILHSPVFTSCDYLIHHIDVSDHFPVTVNLYKLNSTNKCNFF